MRGERRVALRVRNKHRRQKRWCGYHWDVVGMKLHARMMRRVVLAALHSV